MQTIRSWKQWILKWISIMITITIVFTIPFFHDIKVNANPYPVNGILGSTGEWSNCTWSVWQLVYTNMGIELPAWGNAGNWYKNAKSSGYATGSEPAANSIICYDGHVAYVTAVNDEKSKVYIKEGGYGNAPNLGYHEGWSNAKGSREYTGQTIYGYIYLDSNSTKWYNSMTPWNIGDEVYCAFIKKDGWATLGSVEKSVEITPAANDASDIWHFVRQEDNSYIIYNCKNNLVLDGYDGENVNLYEYYGGNCQQWYIYGPWNGEYVFRHKGTDKVLCIPENSNEYGTKLKMAEYDNSYSQQFSVYGFDPVGTSSLSVTPGNSVTPTELNWTPALNATHYSIRIKNGAPGNVETYQDLWYFKDTSNSIILPAGYYEIYIDSCNKFSYSGSNIVSFYITDPQPGDINGNGTITTEDITLLQKYLLNESTLTEAQYSLADLNADGTVNGFDLTLLRQKLLA